MRHISRPAPQRSPPASPRPAPTAPGTLRRVSPERDLFANFERMRREIDELFGDVFERTGFRGRGFSPSVDVYYTDDPPRAVVKADLAGVLIDDVALEIRGRQLLIAGERRAEQAEGRLFQQIEIEHGPFRRSVELGADVVAEEAAPATRTASSWWRCPLASREERARSVRMEGGPRVIEIPTSERRRAGGRRGRRHAGRAADPAAEGQRPVPRDAHAARRGPGALGEARERRARRQPDARDGGLEVEARSRTRGPTTSTAWAWPARWRG